MSHVTRYVLACALIIALLLGQHASALHALGHAIDGATQNDGAPLPTKCADHSIFATIGAALGSNAPVAPFVAAVLPLPVVPVRAGATLAQRFNFRPRAPPALA
jgi:hypothetical protein